MYLFLVQALFPLIFSSSDPCILPQFCNNRFQEPSLSFYLERRGVGGAKWAKPEFSCAGEKKKGFEYLDLIFY